MDIGTSVPQILGTTVLHLPTFSNTWSPGRIQFLYQFVFDLHVNEGSLEKGFWLKIILKVGRIYSINEVLIEVPKHPAFLDEDFIFVHS